MAIDSEDDGTVRLPGGTVLASPVVILRIAGLPMAELPRLRTGEAFREAVAIVRLRAWLASAGRAISAELYEVIGAWADGADKAALVGLRRRVFRGRRPSPREWNEHVAGLLPAELAARLRRWAAAQDAHDRLGVRLPATLDRETGAARTALRDAVRDPGFQRALSLSSPTLYAETARWLADESRVPRRSALVRLAGYAARAATDPSPDSTFTMLGWGTWSRRGPDVRLGRPESVVHVTELTGHLLALVRQALRNDPRLSALVPIRLNPSASYIGATVRFLGPPPGESVVALPATPQVLACLRVLNDGAAVRREVLRALLGAADPRTDPLIDHLVDTGLLERQLTGAGLLEHQLASAGLLEHQLASARLLEHQLASARLLEHQLAGADLDGDPLDELGRWLAANGAPEEATAVRQLRSALRHRAAVPDVPAQLAARRVLGAAVDELTALTGSTPAPGERWREYAVLPGPIGKLSSGGWRAALADLDLVRRMLAVLDPALTLRVALAAYCCERFGPGARVPLLTLHESIVLGLARRTAQPRTPIEEILELLRTLGPAPDAGLCESRLPRLREVARLRRDFWRTALVPPDRDGVIRPDTGALGRLAASWPRWIGAPRSMTCCLQVIRGDGLRVALNAAQAWGRNRALHLIRAAGGHVPADRPDPEPDVRLRDLSVVHDPATGSVSLFAAGHRAPVMPADVRLPPAGRLLVQAFGPGYLVFAPPAAEPVSAGIRRLPRVEVGRVVLHRAQWIIPAGHVPTRGKGESGAGYLVRLAGWLLARDIPVQCFVRVGAATPMWTESRTSVYVDFANWYLVQAFERMVVAGATTVTFEEALPEALGPAGGDARATEFLIELVARDEADV